MFHFSLVIFKNSVSTSICEWKFHVQPKPDLFPLTHFSKTHAWFATVLLTLANFLLELYLMQRTFLHVFFKRRRASVLKNLNTNSLCMPTCKCFLIKMMLYMMHIFSDVSLNYSENECNISSLVCKH